jgi:stress response protein YsnF
MKTVIGLFDTEREAGRALDELTRIGYEVRNISIVTNSNEPHMAAVRMDAMKLDDVGTVVAWGPLRHALANGSKNNLRRALASMGLSQAQANQYATGVERGRTLESVVVLDSDADKAAEAMRQHAMEHVAATHTNAAAAAVATAAATTAAAATATATAGREPRRVVETDREWRIPVVKEELHIGKRAVERGGVRVTVRATETPVAQDIRLHETHVDVERHPANRALTADEVAALRERVLEVDELAEELVVEKQARVIEEVVIKKHASDRVETVRGAVREDHAVVEKLDAADLGRFYTHFDRERLDGNFEDYLPAYRYGAQLRAAKFASWEDAEREGRARWESVNPGTWARFQRAIRYAFAEKMER